MNITELSARISFIFGMKGKDRYRITRDEDGTPIVIMDYHELKVSEGRRYLNNVIAMLRNGCRLEIIHGFNHGTDMKAMVWACKSDRIVKRYSPTYNPGITFIDLAAA